jgi:hypothetical protein
MYGVAGEKRPIFVESDAFLYNLGDPTIVKTRCHWLYDYIVYHPRLSDLYVGKITRYS